MTSLDEEYSQKYEDDTEYEGVFITKGESLKLTFPDGYILRINDDGEPEGGRAELHIGLNTCPYWLRIAYDHLLAAEECNATIQEAVEKSDDERLAPALEGSFAAGMQAIVASAVGIDALYASVKEHIAIPDDVLQAWAKNKTARYKQIAETFRLGFQISSDGFKQVRSGLEELFRFRNWAVHPPFEVDAPKPHPDVGKFTEWRFVAFRYDNAHNATGFAISLAAQLLEKPRDKFGELTKHCEGLKQSVHPLVEQWEDKFGQLIPKEETDGSSSHESAA